VVASRRTRRVRLRGSVAVTPGGILPGVLSVLRLAGIARDVWEWIRAEARGGNAVVIAVTWNANENVAAPLPDGSWS
jgi:hypothetical protein